MDKFLSDSWGSWKLYLDENFFIRLDSEISALILIINKDNFFKFKKLSTIKKLFLQRDLKFSIYWIELYQISIINSIKFNQISKIDIIYNLKILKDANIILDDVFDNLIDFINSIEQDNNLDINKMYFYKNKKILDEISKELLKIQSNKELLDTKESIDKKRFFLTFLGQIDSDKISLIENFIGLANSNIFKIKSNTLFSYGSDHIRIDFIKNSKVNYTQKDILLSDLKNYLLTNNEIIKFIKVINLYINSELLKTFSILNAKNYSEEFEEKNIIYIINLDNLDLNDLILSIYKADFVVLLFNEDVDIMKFKNDLLSKLDSFKIDKKIFNKISFLKFSDIDTLKSFVFANLLNLTNSDLIIYKNLVLKTLNSLINKYELFDTADIDKKINELDLKINNLERDEFLKINEVKILLDFDFKIVKNSVRDIINQEIKISRQNLKNINLDKILIVSDIFLQDKIDEIFALFISCIKNKFEKINKIGAKIDFKRYKIDIKIEKFNNNLLNLIEKKDISSSKFEKMFDDFISSLDLKSVLDEILKNLKNDFKDELLNRLNSKKENLLEFKNIDDTKNIEDNLKILNKLKLRFLDVR